MFQTARAIVEALVDLVKLIGLFLRPAGAIRAENLVLRKQLAAYIERGIQAAAIGPRWSCRSRGVFEIV